MTYQREITESLTEGAPVRSSDGHELGRVKEVRGSFFKVDVRMHPDYWLSLDTVATATPQGVHLSVSKDHVDDVKTDAPLEYDLPGARAAGLGSPGPQRIPDYVAQPAALEGAAPANAPAGTRTYLRGDAGTVEPNGYESWVEVSAVYRGDWERANAAGGRWDEVEPGFRYGWEMARDQRYQGRPWTEVEPVLASEYPAWMNRQNYGYSDNSWNSARENARSSWDNTRSRMTGE